MRENSPTGYFHGRPVLGFLLVEPPEVEFARVVKTHPTGLCMFVEQGVQPGEKRGMPGLTGVGHVGGRERAADESGAVELLCTGEGECREAGRREEGGQGPVERK